MYTESYKQIKTDIYTCIKPGKSLTLSFLGDEVVGADRLFITGETNVSPYWKTEPDYQMLYRRIDDSLSSEESQSDRFCLDLSGERADYPKIAFKKLTTPFHTPMFELNDCTDRWTLGISARAEGLKIYGYLRVTAEIRYIKEGVDKHSTISDPDEIFTIDIPEGSYDWQKLEKVITFDEKNTASVCFFVEGEDYEGKIYLEAPRFESESGHNLVGQFIPHTEDRKGVNWIGQNLSKIEWISIKVDLNGRTVFDGDIFERCHRFSEAELPIPSGALTAGENTITIHCMSNYRDAAGYVLREFGFITDKKDFVIASPEIITVGKPFFICVEGKAGEKPSFISDTVRPVRDITLKNDGLNAVELICDTPAICPSFVINGERVTIARCVEREEDGVITGTGDLIYIPAREEDFKRFLKWYLSENIGKLLTVRPTYRWNGTRVPEASAYKKAAELLDSMGIYYSHMLDGRELPGCDANPTADDLASERFLGRQTHEFDGQFAYWGKTDVTNDLSSEMFFDLFLRMYKKHPERMNLQYIPENIHYNDNGKCIFRSPEEPSDMQSAAELFVKRLIDTRKGSPRHTGPSTLFKYLYQAGYKWVGAELMYTPTELTISALRGANRVYGGKTGAHHAVQWSSSPHDTESRYRRYRLALFISYMQGIDEINTEEGLWRLEEYYNYHHRFSPACKNHLTVQKDFNRYILSHTRRGKFYTPIAFLSGRYDGWKCFGRDLTWGVKDFGFEDIERSWDLLTFFYPKSVLNHLYSHNCPDKEIGYYSGTPLGSVDILPIEANSLSGYRLIVASGYNKAIAEDMEKLREFVENGGELLIGWPQLSTTTDRRLAVSCHHSYIQGLSPTFTEDTYCGHPVSVSDKNNFDEVLIRTDSGAPLVAKKKIGCGSVYLVNAKEYAGARAVDLAFRDALSILAESAVKAESIYARADRSVQFTVYDKEDGGRDIYLIATDWHKKNADGTARIIIGSDEYEVKVPWGQLVKVTAKDDIAVIPERDECEVLSLSSSSARVQGVGKANFIIFNKGKERTVEVDFTDSPIANIAF